MAVGFRKSLLGFNCSDVIEYIEKTHKNFVSKEKKLNEKLDAVNNDLNLALEEQKNLILEKQELSAKLDEFYAKYDEIERLSENIGKLYLVAQMNSRTMIDSSAESAKIALEEAEKNIGKIDEAQGSLNQLRAEINEMSDEFSDRIYALVTSLADAKEQISENSEAVKKAEEEFNEIYESVTV